MYFTYFVYFYVIVFQYITVFICAVFEIFAQIYIKYIQYYYFCF